MRFELFLSRRYFSSTRSQAGFLSFIKRMAIGGVCLGSAGLLIALMIVHGFKSVIQDKTLGFAPNITIETFGAQRIHEADTLAHWAAAFPGVNRAEPVILGQGMAQVGQLVEGTFLKGVPRGGDLTRIPSFVTEGVFDVSSDSMGRGGAVIGQRLARRLSTDIGDVLTLFAATGLPSPENPPEIRQFTIRGVYQTGIEQFDDVTVYLGIDAAAALLGFEAGQASMIEVLLENTAKIRERTTIMDGEVGFPYYAASVYETHANIFAWIDLQEATIPLVIGVLVLIAAFNLIGAILMMVLERTRDIGILKAMGATDTQIRRVFLFEGFWVAIWGLLLGIGIALLFYWLQATWQIIPLSEENYYMAYAPVKLVFTDFIWVSAITLLLCLIASWFPARVAARTHPLKVIAFGR